MQKEQPFIAIYRTIFHVAKGGRYIFEFSADERAELFIDGEFCASGPERGDLTHWYKQDVSLQLDAGEHCLCARVLALGGNLTAMGQLSLRHGFYLNSDLVDTANGNWQVQLLNYCEFVKPYPDWGTYAHLRTTPDFNYEALAGRGGDWQPVERYCDDRSLLSPMLPPLRYDPILNYRVTELYPGTLLVVFDDYVCAWSEFIFSGCGSVQLRWAESFYEVPVLGSGLFAPKGDRNQTDGKFFIGNGDHLELPGGQACRWRDHWWRAGRYLEITLRGTALQGMFFFHTGYPFPPAPDFSDNLPELRWLLETAFNTLTKCSGETYFDCPYYEQLMYVGDARIEALCGHVLGADPSLPLKALMLFAASQRPDGMICSRTPSREEQVIPSFALVYVMMLHDFALYQNQPETIRSLLPVARKIADYFLQTRDNDNIFEIPGWNFIDWVKEWQETAAPPGNCAINFMAVLMLKNLAELELEYGSAEQAAGYADAAAETARAVQQIFWSPERRLFADDRQHAFFSEHAQVMALLSGTINAPDELINGFRCAEGLAECGIYFSFYYLEACYRYRLVDLFEARLKKFYELRLTGLRTLPEHFKHSRSDCHAWSSHVLFHYFASIKGRRPQRLGGRDWQEQPIWRPGRSLTQ